MSTNARIEQVVSRRHLDAFIKVPWTIYRGDPNWVPPLISDMKKMLDRAKFPFFQHSTAAFFVAYEGARPVGRIAAIHNHRHCEFHGDQTGFFGFFESIDSKDVAEKLFDTAARWLRVRGLRVMRGPTSYSINDTCGLLVDGFNSPPFVMMAHNPPYYAGLLEACGFKKAKDLLAFLASVAQASSPSEEHTGGTSRVAPRSAGPQETCRQDACGTLAQASRLPAGHTGDIPAGSLADARGSVPVTGAAPDVPPRSAGPEGRIGAATGPRGTGRYITPVVRFRFALEEGKRLAARLAKRYQVIIRQADFSRFQQEVEVVRKIYNGAWEQNWGFVPMNEAEFNYMAGELRRVADPGLLLIGEAKGKPVAFALALPNINEALAKINGRLFPTGIFKLLWHARKIRSLRVITLGVLKEYRRKGLDALLYLALIERASAKGFNFAELSWVLEDNLAMIRPIEELGGRVHKRYRLYDRDLGARGRI